MNQQQPIQKDDKNCLVGNSNQNPLKKVQGAQQKKIEEYMKLPNEYLHYSILAKNIYKTRTLFKVLFLEWNACLKCIFKIYAIQVPKLYSDYQFFPILIQTILGKQLSQQVIKKYNNSQCTYDCKECWLCQQVLQQSYVRPIVDEIVKMIQQKKFQHYEKFKLNIKIPLIFVLKYYFFCRYLTLLFETANKNLQQESNYRVDNDQLYLIQKLIKFPYDALCIKNSNSQILQLKVVLKWLISYHINSLTPLQSTIQDSVQMLTINIDQSYHNSQLQSRIMKLFHNLLGLQKKKNDHKNNSKYNNSNSKPYKKVKIDLGQQEPINQSQGTNWSSFSNRPMEQFRCIAANVNKILWLTYEEIQHILKQINLHQFIKIIQKAKPQSKQETNKDKIEYKNHNLSVFHQVTLFTQNVYLSGRYTKHSRYLSQTPWMVNGQKLTDGSLQQQIQDQIYRFFYPGIQKQKIQIKFHSGGRQDIDVRMLKGGRPFVLEFVSPILRIRHLNFDEIVKKSNLNEENQKSILQKFKQFQQKNNLKGLNDEQSHSRTITFLFQEIVNRSTQLVQVYQFKEADQSFISIQLKKAEIEKIKHYLCYIISEEPLDKQDQEIVSKIHNLQIQQKTPLRVLHRRTLMIRKKMVHKAFLHLVTRHSAILQLWASAGTYIKQFVHGDLCRTLPNLGTLINKKVDILQLDVGSLKEGLWQQGAQQSMKIQKFQWMNQG